MDGDERSACQCRMQTAHRIRGTFRRGRSGCARFKDDAPVPSDERGNIDKDTVYLVAVSASASGRVYCLHMHTGSGMVGAVDTLIVNPSAQQAINGVWGEPDGAGIDNRALAGGSGGLLNSFRSKTIYGNRQGYCN